MKEIETKLNKQNIQIDYAPIRQFVFMLVGLNVLRLIVSTGVSCRRLCSNYTIDLLNVLTMHVAVLISSLSKCWYLVLVSTSLIQFRTMNNVLKLHVKSIKQRHIENEQNELISIDSIATLKQHSRHVIRSEKLFVRTSKDHRIKMMKMPSIKSISEKTIELIRIHSEIIEQARAIHGLFSFQLLNSFAYTFLIMITDLYFLYIGLTNQRVPSFFQCFANTEMSSIFFILAIFISGNIAFICWRTQNESNRIGCYLLRIANKIDDEDFYKMVTIEYASMKT